MEASRWEVAPLTRRRGGNTEAVGELRKKGEKEQDIRSEKRSEK